MASDSSGWSERLDNLSYGIVVKAVFFAALLAAAKWFVHAQGWEFIETLGLLTALMGGVVFTLAIILAGVLADFKESERIVGELASTLRRLYWDMGTIATGDRLVAMRKDVLDLTRAMTKNLHEGHAIHMREVYAPVEALDAKMVEQIKASGASSLLRTVQVNIGNVVRIADRMEVVIETTFMKAGYYFAGITVAGAIVGLMFTRIEPFFQAELLYGFACFLLLGLAMLVWDLDNPFAGAVTISIRQLEKVEKYLADHARG